MRSTVRIAVFGSWRGQDEQRKALQERGEVGKEWANKNSRAVFEDACQSIGREIARTGNCVIVASDSPRTVDYQIAKGILDIRHELHGRVSRTPPPIVVLRHGAPRSSRGLGDCRSIFGEEAALHPELFEVAPLFEDGLEEDHDSRERWAHTHDHIVEIADRILVIGGSSATHRTANIALGKSRPLVAIGSFGGAGAEILKMLEKVRDPRSLPRYAYRRTLARPDWTHESLDASLFALKVRPDPMERKLVFINYRRSISSDIAQTIARELGRVGLETFLDVDGIEAGEEFGGKISAALSKAKVVLAMIGPEWETTRGKESGDRRLFEANDFVRRELEIALNDEVTVIPVLHGDREILDSRGLPSTIQRLVERNVHRIIQDRQSECLNLLVERVSSICDARDAIVVD